MKTRYLVRRVLPTLCAMLLAAVLLGLAVHYTSEGLAARQIRSGFAFLDNEAGFDLGESVLRFSATDSYARAFAAGMFNSIAVFVLAGALAAVAGVAIGLGRVSPTAMVRHACGGYVELIRNLPVALQLLIWYAVLTELPPAVDHARQLLPGVYVSKAGVQAPWPIWDAGWGLLAAMLVLLAVTAVLARRHAAMRWRVAAAGAAMSMALGAACWHGWQGGINMPAPRGLSVSGGIGLSPELLALTMGLGLYTASYVAEIVRAGVGAVPAGQWEACMVLGLGRSQTLRQVIMPQAWRVAIPPLTSQFLNLAKNSSLGVLVGYPDLVAVANTAINQTGQAIECIAIIMAVFLTLNLVTAAVMQRLNQRLQFKVRP